MFHRSVKPAEHALYRTRVRVVLVLFLAALSAFLVRLYRTNVELGSKYAEISENNFLVPRTLFAKRGAILDRRGHALAESRISFSLFISRFKNKPEALRKTLEELGKNLSLDTSVLDERLERLKPRWSKLLVAKDLSLETVTPILERKADFPGVVVEESFNRFYVYGADACHVTGYTGMIAPDQWRELRALGYDKDDEIGVAGIEKTYESYLRGKKGEEVILQDARGRYCESYLKKPSEPGADVVLTLDAELQRAASSAMQGKQGVVLAVRPDDGEILALVSKPDFDPNDVAAALRMSESSFFDKAIRGTYTPGSTFKPIVALAILEEGIDPSAEVSCDGSYYLAGWKRPFLCNVAGGHGAVDLRRALQVSCNVYFYEMARRVGARALLEHARRLGLDRVTGVDLPNERAGSLPLAAADKMPAGEVIQLGIGQGLLSVTPIEMLMAYCGLINGGKFVQPHLVSRITDADGNVAYKHVAEESSLELDEEAAQQIVQGLRDVVNKEGGTAFSAQFPPKWHVAGKTGTAQTPHEKTDAWFICFAPAEQPEIALLVLVEQSGHGGEIAAPIARSILGEYFERSREETGRAGED
jgi:penicillin-binding protein 2